MFKSILENPFVYLIAACFAFIASKFAWKYTQIIFKRGETWRQCAHGIRGGSVRQLCEKCRIEKESTILAGEAAAEAERLAKEIGNRANKFRSTEAKRLKNSFVLNVSELRNLSPQQFEDAIAMMFRRLGYQVEQTPYSNDHGRDAVMKKDGKKYLLECKKYGENNSSGRPDLQKFHSAIMSDKAAKGYFVTTGRFSAGATRFAEKVPIELVDNDALSRLMAESKAQCDENDNYLSVCRACGELVGHNIRAPFDGYCVNGHRVRPSLSLDDILPSQFSSIFCSECSSPMRLKNGKWGKFWGCTKYPICKNKKRFRAI